MKKIDDAAVVYQISSKSDYCSLRMAIYQFSRWRTSAILNFRGPRMGSSKSPCIGLLLVASKEHVSYKVLSF